MPGKEGYQARVTAKADTSHNPGAYQASHPINMDAIGTMANSQNLAPDSPAAIEVMRQQQLLLTKLQALAVPLLRMDDPSAQIVVHLLDDVFQCNISVIAQLDRGNTHDTLPAFRNSTIHNVNLDREQRSFSKRRRRRQQSGSLVTDTPHYDGHQWRKYGQKYINGLKHPRCYYRCVYNKDENCKAAKTIQKMGNSVFSFSYDTTQYMVVYYGHHSCMSRCHDLDLTYSYTTSCDHQNIFHAEVIKDDVMDSELSILLNQFTDIPLDPQYLGGGSNSQFMPL